jgi:arylsulfatase A-like enzyme
VPISWFGLKSEIDNRKLSKMNILWILEDALRPDHMGCYGYSKNTTPHCDRLAREGVGFDSVIAVASHTLPPIVSMLMGQTPATHGIVSPKRYAEWIKDEAWRTKDTPLKLLASQGYLIDGELVMHWAPLGFKRDTASDKIEDYFEAHRHDKWFFFAEPYPTHLPYNPPEEYFRMFYGGEWKPDERQKKRIEVVRSFLIVHPSGCISKMEAGEKEVLDGGDEAHKRTAGTVDLLPEDKPAVCALYDGEVRVFDDLVGRWTAKLEQLGILDETLIIITADHGEELMERGHVGHCSCNLNGTLYDESIRVPLIMRFPQQIPAGRVVAEQISQIDIMPTIFDMLGIKIPDWMEGQSVLPIMGGCTMPARHSPGEVGLRPHGFRAEAYSETMPAGWQALTKDDRQIFAVRTGEWKLIKYIGCAGQNQRLELFDLKNDPGEHCNLAWKRNDMVQSLLPKLESYIRSGRK